MTRAVFPSRRIRFVGDAGLDDQKIFAWVAAVDGEFVIRASRLERRVEIANPRLDRWETEQLQDLMDMVPFATKWEVAFTLGSVDVKTREQLIGQIQFFWKLIPNLKWEIQEMLQDGNTVILRSVASGTPNGDFIGVPTDGSRAFSIMTIDIHTVENGKVVRVYH